MSKSILPASLRNLPVARLWAIACRGLPRYRPRLRRRPACPYIAEGGPYHGHTLLLTYGTTAVLSVGQQRGRYRCGLATRMRLGAGTTVWRPVWRPE